MHGVAFQAAHQHIFMKVDLITMLQAPLLKLIDGSFDIGAREGLRVRKQDMVISLELWPQRKLECHAETLTCSSVADISRYTLPFLRENWHLAFL